jgi:hypothetical protein
VRDPRTLTQADIEAIEKISLRWLHRAAYDFGFEVAEIFRQSTDDVTDVAEDITREMLDRLGGYSIQQRVLGNVDYRKARYIIQPDWVVRQALFVDSKAEKAPRTATLQMSQLSMRVRQRRAGQVVEQQGNLQPVAVYGGARYITTTLLAHYYYEDVSGQHMLKALTLAAVPNGVLQDAYNPSSDDTIWLVGRNAATLGEDFRVRLGFERLRSKKSWRVQRIEYNLNSKRIEGEWKEEGR